MIWDDLRHYVESCIGLGYEEWRRMGNSSIQVSIGPVQMLDAPVTQKQMDLNYS